MFNLTLIPSNSTGNSAGQDPQLQVGRRGRYANRTPQQHDMNGDSKLIANEQDRKANNFRANNFRTTTSEQREHLLAQRRQTQQEETEDQRNRRLEYHKQ